MTRPILWENIIVSTNARSKLIKRKTVAVLIVAVLTITSVLAYFHNLDSSFQNRIQQITRQLEAEKSQQRKQLEDQLHNYQRDNDTLKKQVKDLQKQVSIKKQQQAAELAAAQAAQQAAQSAPSAQVASSGNCAAYEPLVAQYAWNTSIAMAVMRAESGCNPTATSPTCDHGLMQINCVHAAAVGGNLALLNDPATNIRVAYQVYSGAGWSAWTTYTSGAYLRYLM